MKFVNMKISQKAILNLFENVCWKIEPKEEGRIGYLMPCIEDHTFKAWCDEAGKFKFYLSYFKYHNPNRNYQIENLTPKTYADQQFIDKLIRTLMSDKSLNIGSYNNDYELYITRTNRHDYDARIYPALKVFVVEDTKDTGGYNEWQTVLSRLEKPSF